MNNEKQKQKQIRYDTMYMDVAKRISHMSYCERRRVGAILVESGNIISFGWNGQPAGMHNGCEDDTNTTYPSVLHAEYNAIEKIRNAPLCLTPPTLFVTTTPCRICAEEIVNFGIARVVYSEKYRLTDGIDYLLQHNVIVEQQL